MTPVAAKASNVMDFIQPDKAKDVGGEIEKTTLSLAQRLSGHEVTDMVSLEQAVSDRKALGEAAKRVEEFFEPFISMAHKLHKALCDRKNTILAPILTLDGMKRGAISEFKAAQDRVRQARERELADQQRKDNEARAAHEAAALEHAGEHEMAAAVVEEAIAAPTSVVVLPDATKQVVGLKFTRRYLWRCTNNDAARALQLVPREYLCIDEKKIGAYARAMKGTGTIPGIQFYHVDDPVR